MRIDELVSEISSLSSQVDTWRAQYEDRWDEEKRRNDELARVLERIVEIGLRGNWVEFQDTPLKIPLVQLAPSSHHIKAAAPREETRDDKKLEES